MNNDRYTHISLCDFFPFLKLRLAPKMMRLFFVIMTHEQLCVGMALLSHIIKLQGTDWNKW